MPRRRIQPTETSMVRAARMQPCSVSSQFENDWTKLDGVTELDSSNVVFALLRPSCHSSSSIKLKHCIS